MSGTGASLSDKIDLAPWGYAPGDSFVTCSDCEKIEPLDSLHVMHRHSTRCSTHALKARQNALRLSEVNYQPDPDQQLQDEVYGLIQAYSDHWVRIGFIGSIMLASCLIAATLFATP